MSDLYKQAETRRKKYRDAWWYTYLLWCQVRFGDGNH